MKSYIVKISCATFYYATPEEADRVARIKSLSWGRATMYKNNERIAVYKGGRRC